LSETIKLTESLEANDPNWNYDYYDKRNAGLDRNLIINPTPLPSNDTTEAPLPTTIVLTGYSGKQKTVEND